MREVSKHGPEQLHQCLRVLRSGTLRAALPVVPLGPFLTLRHQILLTRLNLLAGYTHAHRYMSAS